MAGNAAAMFLLDYDSPDGTVPIGESNFLE